MTKHKAAIYILLIAVLSACAPRGAVPATELPTTPQPPTVTPYPTNTPTPIPTPTEMVYSGEPFTIPAIPVGQGHPFERDGEAFTITMEGALTGQAAQALLKTSAPPGTTWLVVNLGLARAPGGLDEPVAPLPDESFSIITNGHVDPPQPQPLQTKSPAPGEIALLPGETRSVQLAYLVYSGDPAPQLRLSTDSDAVFFDLLGAGDLTLPPDAGFTAQNAVYTEESPLPVGDALYALRSGEVFRLQVDQVLRGERAALMLSRVLGATAEPPEGQEYILPHLTIKAAYAQSDVAVVPLDAFASLSQGEAIPAPDVACTMPCLQSAQLLPNGIAAGWLPLLVDAGDAAPMLVLDDMVFLSLASEIPEGTGFLPPAGADVIGYATRKQIASVLTFTQAGPVYAVAFSPDGTLLASGGDDRLVHLWDLSTGSERVALPGFSIRPRAIDFSPDGSLLAAISASNELMIWETSGWTPVFTNDGAGNGLAVKFLPEDTLVVVTSDGSVTLWDLVSLVPLRETRVPSIADPACRKAVVFSFDTDRSGDLYAASLSCGYGMIWRAGDDKPFYIEYSQQVDLPRIRYRPKASSISLSPDGTTATYGMVYYPELWLMTMEVIDVPSGNVIAALSPMDPHLMASSVTSNNDLMFAGVGNLLTLWWSEGGRWNVNNFIQLKGHAGLITNIAISSDGRQMASTDYSGRIIVWRVVP